ncbi:50S ribosomal protein L6 [archaeon]|nr:MAG: 50S ribosomal protein L6 [archaeon]
MILFYLDEKLTFFVIYPTVTVAVKARDVTVTGPKGKLERSFKHLAVDISVAEDGRSLKVDLWFGNRENIAAIRYVYSGLTRNPTPVEKNSSFILSSNLIYTPSLCLLWRFMVIFFYLTTFHPSALYPNDFTPPNHLTSTPIHPPSPIN